MGIWTCENFWVVVLKVTYLKIFSWLLIQLAYDFLGLLYSFSIYLYDVFILSPAIRDICHTPMA